MPEVFTKSELAVRLGVHRNTVKNMLEAGEFPGAYRVTRDWRIPASDVSNYLERRRQAARTERTTKRPAGSPPPVAA